MPIKEYDLCDICGKKFKKHAWNHRYCSICKPKNTLQAGTDERSDFSPTQLSTYFEKEEIRRKKRYISPEKWRERIENQWTIKI